MVELKMMHAGGRKWHIAPKDGVSMVKWPTVEMIQNIWNSNGFTGQLIISEIHPPAPTRNWFGVRIPTGTNPRSRQPFLDALGAHCTLA